MKSVFLSFLVLLLSGLFLGAASVRPFEGLWLPWRLAVRWQQAHYPAAFDSQCMQNLSEIRTANYSFVQEPSEREKGCAIDTPLIVLWGPLAFHAIEATRWQEELVMSCRLATRLRDFTKEFLIPNSVAIFGAAPKAVLHKGSYRCQNEDARPGGHGFGDAVDFAGIELPGGRGITVKAHFASPGPEGQYLRLIARAACHSFGTVLGPRFHPTYADHLHFAFGFPGRCVY